jgi:hypothetical protein
MEEILNALLCDTDTNASPHPDEFGLSFNGAIWPSVKNDITHLIETFFHGNLNMDGLNRTFLVLLPKKEGADTANAFRSLQNCPMKLFNKVLTNRLPLLIPTLIDANQTGFVHGRNIVENFVYVANLLNYCHRRRAPTVPLWPLSSISRRPSIMWTRVALVPSSQARGFDS